MPLFGTGRGEFIEVVSDTDKGRSKMKNTLALLLFLLLSPSISMGQTVVTEHHYVQVGETITFTDTNNTWDATETNLRDYVFFSNSGSKFTITGLVVGSVPFYTTQKSGYNVVKRNIHVIHVVDIQEISLPILLNLKIGENFTFTPLVKPLNTSTTFTWTSSNATIATVDENGKVTATGIGKANIICTSSNGVQAQSLITVSPLLVQSVTLDNQLYELSINENVQLHSTILPINATSSNVKWLSSNENIAQVDDEGNVKAIGAGYCSIFCIADDGSGKFGKCLVHVTGTAKKGDVNEDGDVDVTDIVTVSNIILYCKPSTLE